MDYDRSWMKLSRVSLPYLKGLDAFFKSAYANKSPQSKIKCPCKHCRNRINQTREVVNAHLIMDGFHEPYTKWIYHRESALYTTTIHEEDTVHEINLGDDMSGLLHDAFGIRSEEDSPSNKQPCDEADQDELNENASEFFKLLKDGECELYPGCKAFSLLSFIVRLFHMKTLYKWSHTSFTALLQCLKEALPESEKLSNSYSKARKIVRDLGFDYQKIHACPNNCMLYWKESKDRKDCIVCHTSRWKQFSGESDDDENKDRKIPAKVLRYFPLKLRLQRLFMSMKTSSLMRWHAEKCTNDGILRHPADSQAWKIFDRQNPEFSHDCRNIRLGLASDGFNPFKTMNISHSTWPVVLTTYNLPPWMCMKQPYLILCTLIDGPRGPGNNIDVYLQPLVDELKELRSDGIPTYDATTKKMFRMRAALMWTISDFPAYANLSGWSTKGRLACPCCNKNTRSQWLKNGKKFCYMGHRRWLNRNHKFRNDNVSFDGKVEKGVKPTRVAGDEILKQLEAMERNNEKGASCVLRKRKSSMPDENGGDGTSSLSWKKKSIFFQLPYWKDHLIRHNLDVMHVEKNVCDNILWTLLNVDGKSKDNLKSRRDLEYMGIRKALHPKSLPNNKVYLPPACFTMSKKDKDIFCNVLKNVKVPDGYASNISRRVNIKDRNISGLKSHDNHIIMQQLLPMAVRKALPKNVSKPLIELGNFYRQLCSKTMRVKDFEYLQDRVAITLCHLEKIFPPSFFDVMEHLTIHLAEEAMIAGPVQFRWMYPIERFLFTLKEYVRNRSRPEGSIAEGYLADECMTFCARYLDDVESKFNRPLRNYEDDDMSMGVGRPLGKGEAFKLDDISFIQAHRYVLANSAVVTPFREKHMVMLKSEKPHVGEYEINRIHNETFQKWFGNHVRKLNATKVSKEVSILAAGPCQWARRYTGYIINGFRFRTKHRERRRNTQNSGVMVDATTQNYASATDKQPISGDVTYYGILTDVFELRYSNEFKFVLFRCDWIDNNSGLAKDDFGFTLVNFNHTLYRHSRLSDEPFILASQAKQSWYVQDPVVKDWHIFVKMTPRDLYDMYGKDSNGDDVIDVEVELYNNQRLDDTAVNVDDDFAWARVGMDGTTIDNIVEVDGDAEGDDVHVHIDEDQSDGEGVEAFEDDSEAECESNESDLDDSEENNSDDDDYVNESDDDDS